MTEHVARFASLLKLVHFQNYRFIVHLHKETIQLYAEYEDIDVDTDELETMRTRRWNLTPQMTDSEVIQTAFKLVMTSMEHRAREGFLYKDARVFGPHFDVNDLVLLCKSRENAGARKALGEIK
jgi:hypothetical protein